MAMLPLGPGLDHWDPVREELGYESETVSGRRRRRDQGVTRWRISLGWRNLSKDEAAAITAFLDSRGQVSVFQVDRPDGIGPGDPPDTLLNVTRVGPVERKFRRGGRWDIDIELLEHLA
ncbi:MAG: hypothetical protein OXH27_02035 [Gammaproteobacteria bacterium]|nr:hypothetical protein [Gammaproteobacteria bacterium]MCY3689262.1 hypothetical protein [Gammaproteobacteria bacterium]MXZ13835.1 hypothetical protein [Candidatus Dadabacteria bacterium]MYA36676.1 hypothetical protein [Gammaproteobacteria bacterium]MYE30542.1 hypothetical protein [Gammaproteobacteria bacterium]